jgi:uncharacterized membrane protein YebE (DUF533 family)
MSYANIIEGLLQQGMSPQSHQRMRNGAEYADRTGGTGGIQDILGSLLGGATGSPGARSGGAGSTGAGSAGGFAEMARDFLSKPQAGGMSGGQLGGLGALAGAFLGRGLGGAAKGGAMAILGTLALNAWREYQAQSADSTQTGQPGGTTATARTGGSAGTAQGAGQPGAAPRTIPEPPRLQPTQDQVKALTDPQTERLVMRAMIGAAQVDGRITGAELDKILGGMGDSEVTDDERRAAYAEVSRPVDLEALGREVNRPEVAMQVYLAALMSVDIDTDAERDYFRRLARALKLEHGIVERLHRMTGAPAV